MDGNGNGACCIIHNPCEPTQLWHPGAGGTPGRKSKGGRGSHDGRTAPSVAEQASERTHKGAVRVFHVHSVAGHAARPKAECDSACIRARERERERERGELFGQEDRWIFL